MAIDYPADLPLPLASKRAGAVPGFSMAQPRRGTPFAQPRATTPPTVYEVEWLLQAHEAAAFRDWVFVTLQQGSLAFRMPLRTEYGLEVLLCLFAPDGLLDRQRLGTLWRYRATIIAGVSVIAPPTVISSAGAATADASGLTATITNDSASAGLLSLDGISGDIVLRSAAGQMEFFTDFEEGGFRKPLSESANDWDLVNLPTSRAITAETLTPTQAVWAVKSATYFGAPRSFSDKVFAEVEYRNLVASDIWVGVCTNGTTAPATPAPAILTFDPDESNGAQYYILINLATGVVVSSIGEPSPVAPLVPGDVLGFEFDNSQPGSPVLQVDLIVYKNGVELFTTTTPYSCQDGEILGRGEIAIVVTSAPGGPSLPVSIGAGTASATASGLAASITVPSSATSVVVSTFDGTNGQTTGIGNTGTSGGNWTGAQLSDTYVFAGPTSLLVNGVSGTIGRHTPAVSVEKASGQAVTWEARMRFQQSASWVGNAFFAVKFSGSREIGFFLEGYGSTSVIFAALPGTGFSYDIAGRTMLHVCISIDAATNTLRSFVNGSQVGIITGYTEFNSAATYLETAIETTIDCPFYIDNFRLRYGFSYTANFTPDSTI